jgi:hypothetical protein
MDLNSVDKKVLLALYNCDEGKSIYNFHSDFSFSPAQMSRFVRTFNELKIIEYKNSIIKLTKYGEDWILKNRKSLFLKPSRKEWRKIPIEWKLDQNTDIKKYNIGKI